MCLHQHSGTPQGHSQLFCLLSLWLPEWGGVSSRRLSPQPSLFIQLLSLGGRTRVGVSRIVLGLKTADAQGGPPPAPGPGIDLCRVQAMVGSMGTALSPGAQSLMDLVQFQQQVKSSNLSQQKHPQIFFYTGTGNVSNTNPELPLFFFSLSVNFDAEAVKTGYADHSSQQVHITVSLSV